MLETKINNLYRVHSVLLNKKALPRAVNYETSKKDDRFYRLF